MCSMTFTRPHGQRKPICAYVWNARTLLIGAFNSEQKWNARNNMSTFDTALSDDSLKCNLNQGNPQPISSNSSASLVAGLFKSPKHILLFPKKCKTRIFSDQCYTEECHLSLSDDLCCCWLFFLYLKEDDAFEANEVLGTRFIEKKKMRSKSLKF